MTIQPWYWLVFGVALMTAEMFVPTFALLWFGASAVIISLLAYTTQLSVFVLTLLWLLLSTVFCVLWFRFVKPLTIHRTKAGLGAGVIVGEMGLLIIAPTLGQAGRVRFSIPKAGATEWACRSTDDTIKVGDRVLVTAVLGNELVVTKAVPTPPN